MIARCLTVRGLVRPVKKAKKMTWGLLLPLAQELFSGLHRPFHCASPVEGGRFERGVALASICPFSGVGYREGARGIEEEQGREEEEEGKELPGEGASRSRRWSKVLSLVSLSSLGTWVHW